MKKKSTTLLLNSLLVTTALMCVSCSRNSSPLPIAFEEPTLHSETTNVEAEKTGRILYLMQIGETARSIEEYNKYRKEGHSHNLELVQQMGMVILERGYHSYSPEVQLMTVFGAGVVGNPRILHILDAASDSDDPQVQLTALGYLANLHDDAADAMLARGMTSPYLLIRLETAYYLATMKYPSAVGQIESLMQKAPPEIHGIFPQLFAIIGDSQSLAIMRQMLSSGNRAVRINTILSAANYNRDDLLPQIRSLATHLDVAQQEACAAAFGKLKDESSIPKLNKLTQSSSTDVQLAAWQALYRLGKQDAKVNIETLARQGNLFAIAMLGEIPGYEDTLASLIRSEDLQIKVNATVALLQRHDPRCLEGLDTILVYDSRGLGFKPLLSAGSGLMAWKAIPSAEEKFSESDSAYGITLAIRESMLQQTRDLPERAFLEVASLIFSTNQFDLVPSVVNLLENLQSTNALDLLKDYEQKSRSPLIRNYCNLALFRLHEEGPYEDNLRAWVAKEQGSELIRFLPNIPRSTLNQASPHELTPEETSRLLIDSFQAIANSQNEQGINAILEAIANGNPTNKYALAGLLIRAAE